MEKFVCSKLEELADEKYQLFSAKLIPNVTNVLGVRTPLLRKLAKELYKNPSINIDEILNVQSDKYLEFVLLQGFLIGLKKSDCVELKNDIQNFVPKIDNWAVCDGFCSSLKQVNFFKKDIFEFLQKYLNSNKEYELRFGVVMLLNYYITEDYINQTLEILTKLSSKYYYAQMAIAWALSMCFVKFFDLTYQKVVTQNIQKEILTKTVRKVCESYQSTASQREKLKLLLKA